METKIFIDKKLMVAETKKAILYGLAGLIIFFVIYYFTSSFGHIAFPIVAGGLMIIALITIYRNIVLLFLPSMIFYENRFKYFNALWYSQYSWNNISQIKYTPIDKIVQLENKQGRILNKVQLDVFSDSDINIVLNQFKLTNCLTVIEQNPAFEPQDSQVLH